MYKRSILKRMRTFEVNNKLDYVALVNQVERALFNSVGIISLPAFSLFLWPYVKAIDVHLCRKTHQTFYKVCLVEIRK